MADGYLLALAPSLVDHAGHAPVPRRAFLTKGWNVLRKAASSFLHQDVSLYFSKSVSVSQVGPEIYSLVTLASRHAVEQSRCSITLYWPQ